MEDEHGKAYDRNVDPKSNLPKFFGYYYYYYNGVENCIACKWVYDYKTWLGMHTLGKLLVKSRRRPR